MRANSSSIDDSASTCARRSMSRAHAARVDPLLVEETRVQVADLSSLAALGAVRASSRIARIASSAPSASKSNVP